MYFVVTDPPNELDMRPKIQLCCLLLKSCILWTTADQDEPDIDALCD